MRKRDIEIGKPVRVFVQGDWFSGDIIGWHGHLVAIHSPSFREKFGYQKTGPCLLHKPSEIRAAR